MVKWSSIIKAGLLVGLAVGCCAAIPFTAGTSAFIAIPLGIVAVGACYAAATELHEATGWLIKQHASAHHKL